MVTLEVSAPASYQSGPEEKVPVVPRLRRCRLSLESLELSLVPPPDRSPDWSPDWSLVMSPTELPGKVRSRRRCQTVPSEGPGTATLTRRRQILSWRWCGFDRGLLDTGTADISELLAGGITLTKPDGLLTPTWAPGLAGTADISELGTGRVTLTRPHGLLAPSWTSWRWWRWWRCWGGAGWRRDVDRETFPADVNVGVTGGVALT